MASRLTIEELIEAAGRLAPEERERLVHALAEGAMKPKRHITELRGLGKEIWHGQDAQEYINAERDSWES
ncbi:MAG: hypothetical protein DMG22_10700 [Acidobacteria bacterium]|nr:MAG: hypothetical protein DMG22_10700 [Acidobacteriota bacterium]